MTIDDDFSPEDCDNQIYPDRMSYSPEPPEDDKNNYSSEENIYEIPEGVEIAEEDQETENIISEFAAEKQRKAKKEVERRRIEGDPFYLPAEEFSEKSCDELFGDFIDMAKGGVKRNISDLTSIDFSWADVRRLLDERERVVREAAGEVVDPESDTDDERLRRRKCIVDLDCDEYLDAVLDGCIAGYRRAQRFLKKREEELSKWWVRSNRASECERMIEFYKREKLQFQAKILNAFNRKRSLRKSE